MEIVNPDIQSWKLRIDDIVTQAISEGRKIHMLWLVEQLNYTSRKKLERDFRQHLDTTYCEYLGSLRMEIAHKMLEQKGLSLKAIALSSGYQSPATFCNAFRKRYGMSPSQYRNKM